MHLYWWYICNDYRLTVHLSFFLSQKSLASYVKKYAFKNAKTEDLWGVLSEESGVEVNKLMDTWTKQKGYPVVSVELKDNALVFKQVYYMSHTRLEFFFSYFCLYLLSKDLILINMTMTSLCSHNFVQMVLLGMDNGLFHWHCILG